MEGNSQSAWAEWRRYWPLPLTAAVGYSMLGLQTYAIGPFVAPLEAEFGWSRAEVMWGLTLSNLLGIFCSVAVGALVDRLGLRRVGIAGLLVKAGAFALLASATGTLLNWSLLWMLVAVGALLTQSTIWSNAITGRFDKGRGLALATVLSGTSLCGAISPVLGAWLGAEYGWRAGFAGLGAVWLAFTLPVVWLLFHGPQDERRSAGSAQAAPAMVADVPGLSLREALHTWAFWKLALCGFSFSLYVMAIAPNLVPMLVEKGTATPMAAAQIAGLTGLTTIVARLSAGFLLDLFPANVVGACIFMLPVFDCALMLVDHPGFFVMLLAVITFGVTIGAEFDVIIYLTSRQFGLKAFGAVFGGMLMAGSTGAAIGPVTTGVIHDRFGKYDPMLAALMAMMTISALAVLTIGKAKQDWSKS